MSTQELQISTPRDCRAAASWQPMALLRRMAASGTRGYSPHVRRRMSVINLGSLLASLMAVPYVFLYAFYDLEALWPAVALLSPQIVLYAATPFFHRFGSAAAAVYLSAMWLGFGVGYCFLFGRESGLHLFFLPGAAATVLIFGAERLAWSAVVMVLALVAFLVTQVFFAEPAGFLKVDPVFLDILFLMTVPFVFLLIFLTVLFAFQEASRAELALLTEYRFSERLLENMLPRTVAVRLKHSETAMVADQIGSATILFADIVTSRRGWPNGRRATW